MIRCGRAALLAATAIFAAGCGGALRNSPRTIRYAAHDFRDGRPVSLTDYRRQPILLTSFASWCAECIVELPRLERYYRSHADPTVVAVDLDGASGRRAALALVARNRMTMPIWVDGDSRFVSEFNAPGTPMTVLLTADHRVAKTWFGPVAFDTREFAATVTRRLRSP